MFLPNCEDTSQSLSLFDDNNGMKITKLVPCKNENDCKFFKGMDNTIDSF